jgi:hypothetical protein
LVTRRWHFGVQFAFASAFCKLPQSWLLLSGAGGGAYANILGAIKSHHLPTLSWGNGNTKFAVAWPNGLAWEHFCGSVLASSRLFLLLLGQTFARNRTSK